jgi:tRNA(Ile)-lysidine synthase
MPNLEECARDARYTFLNASADRVKADYVAIAHHADDQAETVMLRLLRGSGAAGLAAMAERGPGRVIRPMMSVTKADVVAYLDSIGETFVTDSSNQSPAMLRNRIRSHLLPMLDRDYAPGLSGRLTELASEMRSLDDFVHGEAAKNFSILSSERGFDISLFREFHPAMQAELIRQFIKTHTGSIRRIERVHIEAIRQLCLEGPPNGALNLPGGIRIAREYGWLRVLQVPEPAASFVIRLVMEGATEIPDAGYVFDSALLSRNRITVPRSKFEALFDANAVEAGLTARSFKAGDKIAPLGMKGHRKVQDIFVDNKLSTGNRTRFPIVELAGAIAWLPGIVRGRVGLVTEATDRVLRVKARCIDSIRAD